MSGRERLFTPFVRRGVLHALLVIIASSIWAQQTPALVSVNVRGTVTSSGSLFTYLYTVSNDAPNVAPISKVDLDITLPAGRASLSSDGLQNGQGFMEDIADAALHDPRTPAVVPVALTAPAGWLTTISVGGTASWISQKDGAAIIVGGSDSGYQITSPGLPAIRNIAVEADYDVNTLSLIPPRDPGDLARYDQDLSEAIKNFRVTAVTVAPSAPPLVFQPIPFLQTIQSYKEQAFRQGWIDNAGVANSLDRKLNAALAALQASDAGTAKNVLSALLNEVEAQEGKHLTSEAVALLRFNTEFLISKLP
jgi:hypothetical protein